MGATARRPPSVPWACPRPRGGVGGGARAQCRSARTGCC